MPYNRDIDHSAPLPSGALPTSEELDALISKSRQRQTQMILKALRRLFSH